MEVPEAHLNEDEDSFDEGNQELVEGRVYSPDESHRQPGVHDGENDKNDLDESNEKYEEEEDPLEDSRKENKSKQGTRRTPVTTDDKESEHDEEEEALRLAALAIEEEKETDPAIIAQIELIQKTSPSTGLEIALSKAIERKETHIARLTAEIIKLRKFISKRKQTYKRKRKDDGAPTRALSAYNIFIQDRFAKLAKENEKALRSEDKDATMKRVPPASLVTSTGNAWKELTAEQKTKYEERAKFDRKRYEEQMAQYQPPDKLANRKRNKTGYNMFFSAHVLRLKQTESGVPSERGSVARLVGTAWKLLAPEDKAYYEREADKHNGMNPVKEGEEDDDDDEIKRQQIEYHMHAAAHGDMQMHTVPPPMHGAMHPAPPHDARHHHGYYPPHMYGPPPPYGHYDYSQHHQRHQQARAQGYNQQGYPPPPRHPYEG